MEEHKGIMHEIHAGSTEPFNTLSLKELEQVLKNTVIPPTLTYISHLDYMRDKHNSFIQYYCKGRKKVLKVLFNSIEPCSNNKCLTCIERSESTYIEEL